MQSDLFSTDQLTGALAVIVAGLAVILATGLSGFGWYLLPASMCVVLLAPDAAKITGRQSIFGSRALFGVFGTFFFFFAPIVHVVSELWMPIQIPQPSRWNVYLLTWCTLSFFGLLLYRFALALALGSAQKSAEKNVRRFVVDHNRLVFLAWIILPACALAQLMVYASFGGISGYMNAYSQRYDTGELINPFDGWGRVFLFTESAPILLAITFGSVVRRSAARPSAPFVLFICCLLAVSVVFFGGLRGSRSTVLYTVFWIAGIVHLMVRPISTKLLSAGLIAALTFIWIYGLYKGGGVEAISQLSRGQATLDQIAEGTDRGFAQTFARDLSRVNYQAFVIYRLWTSNFQLAYGRTFLGSLSRILPSGPSGPIVAGKEREAANLVFGPTGAESDRRSSYVWGLGGEMMMNFGILGYLLAFPLFSCWVALGDWLWRRLGTEHPLRSMLPFISLGGIVLLMSDSDNFLFFVCFRALIPLLMLLLATRRLKFVHDGGSTAGCRATSRR